MSANQQENSANAEAQSGVRFRNRLHRALPNIAGSNAISRIRRISGHYGEHTAASAILGHQEAEKPTADVEPVVGAATSTTTTTTTASLAEAARRPLAPTTNNDKPAGSSTPTPASNPNSPHLAKSRSTTDITQQALSIDTVSTSSPSALQKFYDRQHLHHHLHHYHHTHLSGSSIPVSPATTPYGPCTPGPLMPASVYNAKFSNEHIMNMIKYRAWQKLKKSESEVNTHISILFYLFSKLIN